MQFSDEDLEEFKRRYAVVFGEDLPHAEASEAANNLAELYLFLSQPLQNEQSGTATPRHEGRELLSPS